MTLYCNLHGLVIGTARADTGHRTDTELKSSRLRVPEERLRTTGLPDYGQGGSPRIVVLQHKKLSKKVPFGVKFSQGFRFLVEGDGFGEVSAGSRRSPACFL